jgi:hypothetical protein
MAQVLPDAQKITIEAHAIDCHHWLFSAHLETKKKTLNRNN